MNDTKNPPIAPPRLLIVEDDKSIPLLVDYWLTEHSTGKLSVHHVNSVEHAIEAAPGAACIILDLNLGGKWRVDSTPQVIPLLRQSAPVLVLTGYSEGTLDSDLEFAASLVADFGADAVAFKDLMITPNGLNWLFLMVHAAIGRRTYETKNESQSNPIHDRQARQ